MNLRKKYIGEVRAICFALYHRTCGLCFTYDPKFLELEEIAGRLRTNNGLDAIAPENCVPLCRDCHSIVDTYGRAQYDEDKMTVSKRQVITYLTRRASSARAHGVYDGSNRFSHRRVNPFFGDRVALIDDTIRLLRRGVTAQQHLLDEVGRYIVVVEDGEMPEKYQLLKQWRNVISEALDNIE